MTASAEWISWDQFHQLTDAVVKLEPDCTVIVVAQLHGLQRESLQRQIASKTADAIVVCNKSPSLVPIPDSLPTVLRLMATIADHDLTIAIKAKLLQPHLNLVAQSESLFEFAVRLAERIDMVAIERDDASSAAAHVPSLTTPAGPRHSELGDVIQRLGRGKSSTGSTALKAGLYLINDFFEESHSCSQSIEGMGPHHTGDYWHAILHRREPDYGNSKYWFRHVGRHPIFAELAPIAIRRIDGAQGAVSSKLQPWKARLISENRWDPFAFVDLCEIAARDVNLSAWCEILQYDEMLLLLASTYEEMK